MNYNKFFKLTYEPIESKGEVKLVHTTKVLNAWGKDWVRRARGKLTAEDKNTTKALYNSLEHRITVEENVITISLWGEDYGNFVHYGVQGAGPYVPPKNPSGLSRKPYINRAPDSPFKFGSNTGPTGGLSAGIRKWVADRGLRWRDMSGRFMSYDKMAPRITKNVFQYGIEPTDFAEFVMERLVKKYRARFQLALAKDIANHMTEEVFTEAIEFEILI